MANHSTLSEHELNVVAKLVSKDPEFARVLADAISEQLDKKYGWRQGELTDGFEQLEVQLKNVNVKVDDLRKDMEKGFDNLSGNLQNVFDKQEALARNTKESLLKAIERRLGVPQ